MPNSAGPSHEQPPAARRGIHGRGAHAGPTPPTKGDCSMRFIRSPITLGAWLAAAAGCVVPLNNQPQSPPPYQAGQQYPQDQTYPPPAGDPQPAPPPPEPLPPPVTSAPTPANY